MTQVWEAGQARAVQSTGNQSPEQDSGPEARQQWMRSMLGNALDTAMLREW